VLEIYDRLAGEFSLSVIDAVGDIPSQQRLVRRMTSDVLRGYEKPRRAVAANGRR
jgi:hypothetical protein